jgi:TatD DNase family protein
MPHRGERNDSRYLPLVIKEIAKIKGLTEEEVEEATFRNGIKFFFNE